ncbi:MAG: hypothetical protein ABI760_15295 [Ferruginibacter sp.]
MKTNSLMLGIYLVVCACNKGREVDTDPTQPTITLTLPTNNEVYTSGDSIKIKGTVTDNSLHELRLTITNNANGNILYHLEISVHELLSYDFDQGWKSIATAGTDATVRVEAEDHGNHTVEKEVTVHLNP